MAMKGSAMSWILIETINCTRRSLISIEANSAESQTDIAVKQTVFFSSNSARCANMIKPTKVKGATVFT